MYTKEYSAENSPKDSSENMVNVPLYNVRMMTDDEWNRLAYRNYLERAAMGNAQSAALM